MNPDAPQTPREEIEVRLTALLMGELSPEEAASLQTLMAADAELTALHARLRHAIELLREASALPEQPAPPVPAQLSSERREHLLAHFKAPAPAHAPAAVIVKPRRDWRTYVPLGLAASLIALLGGAVFLNGFAQRKAGRSAATRILDDLRMIDSAVDQYSVESSRSAADATNLAIGQIRDVTLPQAGESHWSSQPGSIPLFGNADANGKVNGAPPLNDPTNTRWLFVHRDGGVNSSSQQSNENPIVGRTAFWTDDESTKLNINTASEGTFWDKSAGRDVAARGEKERPPDVSLAAAEMSKPVNGVAFEAEGRASQEAVRRSVRFTSPAPAAPPAPVPVVASAAPAATPAPNVVYKLYSQSRMKTAESAPTTESRARAPVTATASEPPPTAKTPVLPQSIAGVRAVPTPPGDWDRGLSKHMDGAFGNKSANGNVAFSYDAAAEPHAISEPLPTAGKVDMPKIATNHPARPEGVPREMGGRMGGTARAATPLYLGAPVENSVAQNAPADPGTSDGGISKNMDDFFGEKMLERGAVVANANVGDTLSITGTGTLRTPQLTTSGGTPSAGERPALATFAGGKSDFDAPAQPANSIAGRPLAALDSDLFFDLNAPKTAPASGPAPATPALPEMLAKSDFIAGGTAGVVENFGTTPNSREKASASGQKADRTDRFYAGFGRVMAGDGTVAATANGGGAGGGAARGLGRAQVAGVEKGKASNEEFLGYQSNRADPAALGDVQKESGIADKQGRVTWESAGDFGLAADPRGGVVAGKKEGSADWSGQVVPNGRDTSARGLGTLDLAGVASVEKENAELNLGEMKPESAGFAALGVIAEQPLSFAASQPQRNEFQRQPAAAEDEVRLMIKLARPAKPGGGGDKPDGETRRLSLDEDDAVKLAEPKLREQVKQLADTDSDDGKMPYFRGRGIVETGRSFFQPDRQVPTKPLFESIDEFVLKTERDLKPEAKDVARSESGLPLQRQTGEAADRASLFSQERQATERNPDKWFEQLRHEVEQQRKRADEAAAEMAKIRERDGIVDPNPTDYGAMIGGADRNIVSVESQLKEARTDLARLKGQVAELEKLKPEDLKEALKTLGVQDPEIEKLQGAENSKRLAEKFDSLRANLEVRLQFQEGVVGELATNLKHAKESPIADQRKEKANNYIEAKTKFLQAKRIYEAAQTKLSTELGEKGKPVEVAKLEAVKQQVAAKDSDEKPAASKPAEPAPEPQPEIATSATAFSTFSLNVSDVAFKLAGASLEKGQMPELATVRSEEFINAFDYRDPEPAGAAPLAFATERARYPFAQNRDLVRFSVKTAAAGRQPGRALNIVLLLDNSGSMERADRVRILHESLRVLATQLQPQDKLSVVTFARTPRLWADGVSGDKAAETCARVGEITPQGGTNIGAALDLGYATALRHFQVGSINRVVLLTDGAANLGDVNPDALKQKVEAHRKQGVALDCFGIGWEGYDDTVLEALSRNGDGRYGFINSPEEAATEFAGQLAGALRVAASDVKVQVEWNPRRVTAYRQIGYAKHQLKKEQFRDNTVDAAEIGAAESGNALYVVEVNPRGEGDLATVRVRFKVPGTSDYKEHEWTVPYTKDAPPLEQASPALRLAGTASAFSEWLVSSQYATEVTPDRLLGLLNGVPAIYGADPRPKKLEWMIRTAKSVSGR